MTRLRFLPAFLLLLAARQGWCLAPAGSPAPEGPLPVSVGVYIIDITNINEFENTFDLEVDFEVGWRDTGLAFAPEPGEPSTRMYEGTTAEEMMDGIWFPNLGAVNILGSSTRLKTLLRITEDGSASYRIRAGGTLKSPFDFRKFPFDSQVFRLQIRPFAATSDVVRLVESVETTGFDPDFRVPEWQVEGIRTRVDDVTVPGREATFSQITFLIDVSRKSGFYLWKILLPVLTIVCISWVVFWMTDEQLGRRASTSATAVLTIIAYQFIVSGSLPRIPYLTVMDKVILWSFITTASVMVVNVISSYRGSQRIDRVARIAFPGVYFGVLLVLVGIDIGL